jgi:hypothetical protein
MTDTWYAPALIPNTVGYRLVVRLRDGSVVVTAVVCQLVTGHHYLKGVDITEVASWQPRSDVALPTLGTTRITNLGSTTVFVSTQPSIALAPGESVDLVGGRPK